MALAAEAHLADGQFRQFKLSTFIMYSRCKEASPHITYRISIFIVFVNGLMMALY
jgi:hypothetical protein